MLRSGAGRAVPGMLAAAGLVQCVASQSSWWSWPPRGLFARVDREAVRRARPGGGLVGGWRRALVQAWWGAAVCCRVWQYTTSTPLVLYASIVPSTHRLLPLHYSGSRVVPYHLQGYHGTHPSDSRACRPRSCCARCPLTKPAFTTPAARLP